MGEKRLGVVDTGTDSDWGEVDSSVRIQTVPRRSVSMRNW